MIDTEIIFDAAINRFFVIAMNAETNAQIKAPLDEQISEEFAVCRECRAAMITELQRITVILQKWDDKG